jgi:hypothetical protein
MHLWDSAFHDPASRFLVIAPLFFISDSKGFLALLNVAKSRFPRAREEWANASDSQGTGCFASSRIVAHRSKLFIVNKYQPKLSPKRMDETARQSAPRRVTN